MVAESDAFHTDKDLNLWFLDPLVLVGEDIGWFSRFVRPPWVKNLSSFVRRYGRAALASDGHFLAGDFLSASGV